MSTLFRNPHTHGQESILRVPRPPRALAADESGRVFELLGEGFSQTQAEFAVRRGIENLDQFLNPSPPSLNRFLALPGVRDALVVAQQARAQRSKVAIFGDYDVDGVSATAIIDAVMGELGLETVCDAPCRRSEGYGFNFRMVDEAVAQGCTVMFAVDFGTTQHKVIRYAQERGMKVVVIDHHKLGDFPLPPVDALINPNARGEDFKEFCAAELCMMWAAAVRRELEPSVQMDPKCALSALATVADVMPLNRATNRSVVRHGRQLLRAHPGLVALSESLGISGEASFSDLAFQFGPALNAPGRIRARNYSACGVVERGALEGHDLLLSARGGRLERDLTRIAASICQANQDRKVRERVDYARARGLLQRMHSRTELDRAITLGSDSFDPGVAGLVCSRLSEDFARPAVVIAWEGNVGKGSVRAGGPLRVYEALHACREHCMHYGGHDAAGGLKLHRNQSEAFTRAFAAETLRQLGPFQAPSVEADFIMPLANVERALPHMAEELSIYEPFGNGNLAPTILIPAVKIAGFLPIGAEHFVVNLADKSSRGEAYLWRGAHSPLHKKQGRTMSLACRIGWYRTKGSGAPEPSLEIIAAG